uniref:Heat shock protein 70 n=1 Tax=Spumella elongata TaxID=89044 RepID=A0A7S3M9Z2_9STRA|mmetsp:Transcript_45981/g.80387  ORF Transcript_45981/g.80387 Transcript_45981/m.80387 type:complete len:484 (+) Transcript_45981:13-1464(+)|eukprot:CAMPEP_0184986016 /NCGR_PEP_ID=MMETSP1098-20130426/15279_1 /TAXON_ID=89044 /ORGANISM="Spumella elongata, Strain CCAP 955/1" /LENGTH=483 /DNA_ID=CAMNT_0027510167 /DNA_START=17 /DNA_END=1468 /DNA_ORIENTATION=+
MSIVGIDFGSHTASVAIWYEEKNVVEVLADDLGSRTIPTAVAFRGDEIITGQAAISQMHKNANNTFDDVRSLLLSDSVANINVPLLDKDLTVQEVSSHFFRNIHNQIKQQVGKVVRDCVISVPKSLDEDIRKRLVESAQAGGMRVKALIEDSVSALMAHHLDEPSTAPTRTLVLDLGWSATSLSLYNVSGGLLFPVGTTTLSEASGCTFVNLVAAHCAKEFARKHKIPCDDNKKSMMRLRRECENAMKSLSTGAEATIDIDSLCEGVDYSSKLSRARFEDLITIPFMHLKNAINALLAQAGWSADSVQQVLLSGGGSAIPKVISTLKSMFPTAKFPVGRFEPSETPCIGACLHGKFLSQQGLIESAPTASPVAPILTRGLRIASAAGADSVEVLPVNTVLPVRVELNAALPAGQTKGFVQLLATAVELADAATPLGDLVFEHAAEGELRLVLAVSELGEISLEVVQSADQTVLANLTVPAAEA